MKNTLNNLFLALFLALISQGIQAQFDDIYYDPDRNESTKEVKKERTTDNYTKEDSYNKESNESYYYDDDYTDWEDNDYYYASRIKRFHRPYVGFDYYHGCYVDNYFYDPFDFNPFFYDRDIYVSSYGYRDYHRWRHWQFSPWYTYSYWNNWDWYWGWSSYPFSYGYNYWTNNCYNGYYNNYWSNNYYGGYHHWDHYYNNNDNNNHPNGSYFGSRRFGLTNSSNRGPVRVVNPSPRVFTEAPGTPMTPSTDRNNPKRVIRSADGDDNKPAPGYNPERPTRRQEFPGTRTDAPDKDKGKDQPRYTPRELPGQNNNPNETRPEPRKEYRPERSDRREGAEESKPDFKPERMRRDEPRMERPQEPAPRIEVPRERTRDTYQPPRESRPEPRSERRQEMNTNSGSRSENRSSGDGRRSPR
jgi:hypothetical protein